MSWEGAIALSAHWSSGRAASQIPQGSLSPAHGKRLGRALLRDIVRNAFRPKEGEVLTVVEHVLS
jgi:hypothetical protein